MLITLAIIAAILLLALGLVLRSFGVLGASAGNGSSNGGGVLRHIWNTVWRALHPNFVGFSTDRATTQTLSLLVAAMLIFGAVAVLWAAGAGAMRTAWLYGTQPDEVAKGLKDPWILTTDISKWQAWLVFAGFLTFQVARAIGGVLLISMAAGLVGAMLGFIFGIPRPISAAEAPPAEAGGAAPPPRVSRQQANKAWQLSTNLTQVSDWLTKVIVGVSLVEAKNAWTAFQSVFVAAAGWLFDMRHGSPALIGSVIVGGSVFGFLFAYLYAALIVSRLIAAIDRDLGEPSPEAELTLQQIPLKEGLVPRISRSAYAPEPTDQPTSEEVRAALQYNAIRFEDLIARPDVAFDDVLSWSRAKAILNDYRAAAQGYIYLLGFMRGTT